MTALKTAKALAVLAAALAVGSGTPAAQSRTAIVRTQPSGAWEVFAGGSRIGVTIRDVEQADAKSGQGSAGVVVEDVATDGAAAKAGVRKGDVLVEYDGERVRSVRQVTRLVQETPPGRTVQATLLRDGQRTTVSIAPQESEHLSFDKLDELRDMAHDLPFRYAVPPAPPAPPAAPAPPSPPAWEFGDLLGRVGPRLGISVGSLTDQLADYFGTKRGALVTSVTDESAAAKAGVKAGDVITSFNGSTIEEPSDVRRRAQQLNDGDEFTLEVMRDRKALTLKGKAERTERRRTSRTIL